MRDEDFTAICDRTKKKNEAGISTCAFPLESLSNNSLFGTTLVLCHQIDNKQMNCLPGLSLG